MNTKKTISFTTLLILSILLFLSFWNTVNWQMADIWELKWKAINENIIRQVKTVNIQSENKEEDARWITTKWIEVTSKWLENSKKGQNRASEAKQKSVNAKERIV